MAKKPPKFETIAREYASLWDCMEITRDLAVMERTADRIIACRAAYEEAERLTGVPWYVIGIMDMREGGGGARKHLHNGDSLKRQTVQVPPNRPPGNGPFTFTQSAVDCLCAVKGWDKISDWTIERMAYVFETMNGWGYRWGPVTGKGVRRVRHPSMRSPYLWGGTNHQERGKYIRDHVFDPGTEDVQHGCMPLLSVIIDKCDIKIRSMYGATPDPTMPSPASNAKAEEPGMSTAGKASALTVGGTTGLIGSSALLGDPVGLTSTLVSVKGNAVQLLPSGGITLQLVGLAVIGAGLIAFLIWANKGKAT